MAEKKGNPPFGSDRNKRADRVGIPIGIVAGLWLAKRLFDSLSTEIVSFKAVIYPTSYVWIILSIIGVLLASQIPPIRRIFRLDLAEATKVME